MRGRLDRGAPAYGVALAAIDLGYERLTRAQRNLYDRVVAPSIAALDTEPEPPAPQEISVAGGPAWKPVRTAPDNRDVALAIDVEGAMNVLAFACRRSGGAWVNAATGKPVYVRPTHWREWMA